MEEGTARDLIAVARIDAVPTACAVHDEIDFGLRAGGELDVATTLFETVRQTGQPVAMDAIEHARAETPIQVNASSDEKNFRLRVSNHAEAIPLHEQAHPFSPYFRGRQSGRRDGPCLGLYLVAEIARAHGGTVEVSSSAQATVFTFTMPR